MLGGIQVSRESRKRKLGIDQDTLIEIAKE